MSNEERFSQILLRVPRELKIQLKVLAAKKDITIKKLIMGLILDYLKELD